MKKGHTLPKPVRIPRPYETPDRKPLPMSDPRVRAFFGAAVRYVPKAGVGAE